MSASREHHPAAFLVATAVEQLGGAAREAEKAAKLVGNTDAKLQILRAGELAHLAIHDVQAAKHKVADFHVMQAASLFLEASKTISASLAFDHVAAAIEHIKTAFEAYDQAHAILLLIDSGARP